MNYISDILYWISTGLLVPVIVLLILLFCRSLLLIGGFFGQYMSIRKTSGLLHTELSGLTASGTGALADRLPRKNAPAVVRYMKDLIANRNSKAHRNRIIADFEVAADKDLAISRNMAKLGPMLGLMGTLIPMGPALVGLSTGDISSMAYNMQVAFATTVVGLFAAAVGYITEQVKQRWYVRDMSNLEFISDLFDETDGITAEIRK